MSVAVILTALPVEYSAVRRHLTDPIEETHPQGTVYERGNFVAGANTWEVGIAEIGAGNINAATEVERAIAHFNPRLLFFVGIAGGIKDVAIGDVVAATKVYGYESGKVGEEQFLTRPEVGNSAHALVQRAKAEARKEVWVKRLDDDFPRPQAFVCPIAAGEKVVASRTSELFNFLRSSYNDAVALEMEGYGFLNAAFAYPDIKSIVVRGISDLIEGKNDDLVEAEHKRQERASLNASAFVFEILAHQANINNIDKTEIIPVSVLRNRQGLDSSSLTSTSSLCWKLTLEGNIESLSEEVPQQILLLIRQLSNDATLKVKEIMEGSIVVVLEGSEEGFRVIQSLFNEGQLTELAGLRIKLVEINDTPIETIELSEESSITPGQKYIFMNPPKVFISYSHDSQKHKDRVWELAARLRVQDRIDANIDQYEESPPQGWPRWMMDQVKEADYVLIICTETYERRFRGNEKQGRGKGATWEGAVIIQELYDTQGDNRKFIPVVFVENDRDHIPAPLGGATTYNLSTSDGYDHLCRRLNQQHLTPRPDLGAGRTLPVRDRKQFFFEEERFISLKEQMYNASKGLLNWPRTLGKHNHEIERPEFEKLANLVTHEVSSTTIILGSPGCGKSSLMASIGHWLKEKNITVLGIKADFLSKNVHTIKDLQEEIQLDISLSDAIRAIAHQEKIVLLIDQLDALSELLDRYPARLNILLSLIESLSETDNVHIITTCREFEFRHGTQFSQLEHFYSLNLQLPNWDHVAIVLREEQHDPDMIGDSLRHLLRNPFHLKIFLETAKSGETLDSLPRLLDKLWEERIISDSQSKNLIDCLSSVAQRMTDDEMLWLSAATKDSNPNAFQRLEQLGILMTNPENSTIGFCHQTLYDHTLARSFAQGIQSLSEFILERQDGLFVRPILLRSFNYLRGTALQEYHKQVGILLETSEQTVRQHIRDLVIEFIGSQAEPSSNEIQLLIPLLNSDLEGVKALNSMRGSPGWFRCLSSRPEFTQWLEKDPTQAIYGQLFLIAAIKFDSEEVWCLLEDFWLEYPDYDALSIRTIWDIDQWTQDRVFLIEQIIRRTKIEWHEVSKLAERVAKTMPAESMHLIRAYLDYCYEQAMEERQMISQSLADDENEWTKNFKLMQPFERLLCLGGEIYGIEKFTEITPHEFLNAIWPWLKNVVSNISSDIDLSFSKYRGQSTVILNDHHGDIIEAVIKALNYLAENQRAVFLSFVEVNTDVGILLLQRLISRVLKKIAEQEPKFIFDYLLHDSRRMSLGDSIHGEHCDTNDLISAICPKLTSENLLKLEESIFKFDYSLNALVFSDLEAEYRLSRHRYNRIHRLNLLMAFPDQYLSPEGLRKKQEEMRAFPEEIREDRYPTVTPVSWVGPRIGKDEMNLAKDEDLLQLFDELDDETEWGGSLRRPGRDISRSGGVIQQARAFAELAKEDPQRVIELIPQLQPNKHEQYVGKALVSLSESAIYNSFLIELIQGLDQRGFSSDSFRSNAGRAFENIAKSGNGLPDAIINLLIGWLSEITSPCVEKYPTIEENHDSNLKASIFFGLAGHQVMPGDRTHIIAAIAEGYLQKKPQDLDGWFHFIQSQLEQERHPAVWADILLRMTILFNRDREDTTALYNQIITNFPDVLTFRLTLYTLARGIKWCEPLETVNHWLELLQSFDTNYAQQAYGELLLIRFFQHQDPWSVEQIRHNLEIQDQETVLCGLAHAASHLWGERRCRTLSAEVLTRLASSRYETVQRAVVGVFQFCQDRFSLDSGMRQIIQAVCSNPRSLNYAAIDLTEIIESENLICTDPELALNISQNLMSIKNELFGSSYSNAWLGDSLTKIAIQLHRQNSFREEGLQIFEELLALNVRETQAALESLDRKPNNCSYINYLPLRHRRRRGKSRNYGKLQLN